MYGDSTYFFFIGCRSLFDSIISKCLLTKEALFFNFSFYIIHSKSNQLKYLEEPTIPNRNPNTHLPSNHPIHRCVYLYFPAPRVISRGGARNLWQAEPRALN